MADKNYPSKSWEEESIPNEKELFEKIFDKLIKPKQVEISEQTGKPPMRGFHAKLHAGFMAEFKVMHDLPEYARFGVFAEPRVYPAVVRFSNGTPLRQPDKRPEPRGIAIKLVGVPGPKLLKRDENAVTQDFLATSHSVTSTVRNIEQFAAFIEAEQNRLMLPIVLARKVGIREAMRILTALFRTVIIADVNSMATEHYSGTAPIKFGPYAVKFTVRPTGEQSPQKRQRGGKSKRGDDFLREDLAERLREGDLLFDFVVQFFVNKKQTPIEDTSVRWDTPFETIAQLRIPKCDLTDSKTDAQSEAINRLSFTPWHAIDDHRPLGNIMRARQMAYHLSSEFRRYDQEPTSLPL